MLHRTPGFTSRAKCQTLSQEVEEEVKKPTREEEKTQSQIIFHMWITHTGEKIGQKQKSVIASDCIQFFYIWQIIANSCADVEHATPLTSAFLSLNIFSPTQTDCSHSKI